MSLAFTHIPQTIQGHFLLHFYAAVYRLIYYIHRLSQVGGETLEAHFETYPFLAGYFAEMRRSMPEAATWEDISAWWAQEIVAWETAANVHLPLCALAQEAGVDFRSRMALMLVGLVEEDSRFGTLFAQLQAPLGHRRPCVEVIGHMLADNGWGDGAAVWSVCRPLLESGLIDIANRDAPRSEWVLRVPTLLWDVLRGEVAPHPAPWCQYHPPEAFPLLRELIFSAEFLERLERMPALVQTGKAQAIVLRGMQGSERLEVLGAMARTLGRGVVEVIAAPLKVGEGGEIEPRQWTLLGPLCTMSRSLPVLTYDLSPGETVELSTLPGYRGPVGVLMGFEGGLRGTVAERALTLSLPMPQAAQRLQHWQQALAGHTVMDLAEISARFHLPGGYIRQAGGLAMAQAALQRRETIHMGDIQHACRALNRQLLDTLAARLEVDGSWDRLVVSEATVAKLLELERRCRYREKLLDHLGPAFGSAGNRGVRALFTGASGTGKTLAARLLAAELGMDLYRVDLGAVVNKYIGETEKNLHRVLSRAEELDVILLLDEGDALLGNRTEVKSSNDRYANLETNYLLQRLENYQGIVVVTTNAGQNIDSAFQRRMDVVVHFVPPSLQERWAIWQLHLPRDHAVDSLYLEQVATRCAMTGGQIRNAALHATLLAVDDGSRVVTHCHVEQAVQSEYRKAGALCPLHDPMHEPRSHEEADGGVEAFVQAWSFGSP
jgi:hypothetical protein